MLGLYPCGTVVEPSTPNPMNEGSNPSLGTRREKIGKKFDVEHLKGYNLLTY